VRGPGGPTPVVRAPLQRGVPRRRGDRLPPGGRGGPRGCVFEARGRMLPRGGVVFSRKSVRPEKAPLAATGGAAPVGAAKPRGDHRPFRPQLRESGAIFLGGRGSQKVTNSRNGQGPPRGDEDFEGFQGKPHWGSLCFSRKNRGAGGLFCFLSGGWERPPFGYLKKKTSPRGGGVGVATGSVVNPVGFFFFSGETNLGRRHVGGAV